MPRSRIAFIASAKRGLPAFIHREIIELRERGEDIVLFLTRFGEGIYMPESDWTVHVLSPVRALTAQMLFFMQRPVEYLSLLSLALRTGTLIDLLIGVEFARSGKRYGVTSIHCKEGLHSLSIGYYFHRILAVPLSVTIYADALYIHPSPSFLRDALAACDAVMTVCEFNRDILVSEFGVPPAKVKVVPIYLDTEEFRPDRRTSILIVGQFADRKGHETLFEAVRILDRTDLVVWVVGGLLSGGESKSVDVPQLAAKLGVEDQVEFFGNVSERVLRILYQYCDVFCLPSRYRIVREGTPVALMEAMALERPVISTRHAGIPEYVAEILVDEDEPSSLAHAIAYLVDHPEVRRRQGRRNRRIVAQKFSPQNIEDLISVLRQADAVSSG